MHIPDGFIDARTALATAAISVAGMTVALRVLRRRLEPQRVPLLGLMAAFVFAAQLVNFPIGGGTSGHLIGATLAAVLLGPSAAVLVMSCVLILQCLMFADGGVTALGANIFNMALVSPVVGYAIYVLARRLTGEGLRGRLWSLAFAAWCSTVAAAVACAGQLALSGIAAWSIVFPAMSSVHMLIGLGEALITALVVAAIARTSPELLDGGLSIRVTPAYREFVAYSLLVLGGLLIFVAPFTSNWPDGLEKVAVALGFEGRAAGLARIAVPFPNHTVAGSGMAASSTMIAGVIGTIVAFILAFLLARILTAPGKGQKQSLPGL